MLIWQFQRCREFFRERDQYRLHPRGIVVGFLFKFFDLPFQSLDGSFLLDEDQNSKYLSLREKMSVESKTTLFSVVKACLEDNSLKTIEHLCNTWCGYLRITEEDSAFLSEIKDYYGMPEK